MVLNTGHKGNTPSRGTSLLAHVSVSQASCNSHTPASMDWLEPYWPVCGRGEPCIYHTSVIRDAPLLGVLPLCSVCRTQLPLSHIQTSSAPQPLALSLLLRQPQCIKPVLINIKSGKEAICPSRRGNDSHRCASNQHLVIKYLKFLGTYVMPFDLFLSRCYLPLGELILYNVNSLILLIG